MSHCFKQIFLIVRSRLNIHVLNLYKRAYFEIKIRPNMNWFKIKANLV